MRSFRLGCVLLFAELLRDATSATDGASRCATAQHANPSEVHVAVCLVGAARSFGEPSVHVSLASQVLEGLESRGAVVTLLPTLKLTDMRGSDLEAHFEGVAREDAVRKALSFVGTCNEHVNLTTGLVLHNVSRCGHTALSRQEETAGGTGRTRSMNTFRNWQSALSQLQAAYACGQRVAALEAQTPQRRFAWVLKTRADLRYTGPVWPPVQALDPHTVYKVRDWLELIPRRNFSLVGPVSAATATTPEASASNGQEEEGRDNASPWEIALGSAWRRWLACTPGFKPGSSMVEMAMTAGDGERWSNWNRQQPPLKLIQLPKEWGGAPHIMLARPTPRAAAAADTTKKNATNAHTFNSAPAPLDMAARWAMHRAAVQLNGTAPPATLGISSLWEYAREVPLGSINSNEGGSGGVSVPNNTIVPAAILSTKAAVKPTAAVKPIAGKPSGRQILCPVVHRELTCRDVFPYPAPGAVVAAASASSNDRTPTDRRGKGEDKATPPRITSLRFAVVVSGLVRSWSFCVQALKSQLLDYSAPGSVDVFIHMAINQSDPCHQRAVTSSAPLALHPAVNVMRLRGYPLACSSGGGVSRMTSGGNNTSSKSSESSPSGSSSSNSSSSGTQSSPLETYMLVGQLRSLQQAFAMMADPDQYAAILRFRSDLHLMRPLNLSAAVIGLGNHPSSKSSNGHFLALPCRNIGWDVTYFGTPPAMRALMSAGADGCDGAYDSQPWRAAARHGFVMPRELKNSSSSLKITRTTPATAADRAAGVAAETRDQALRQDSEASSSSSSWEWVGGVSGHHLVKGFRFSDESIDSFPLGLAAPNPPLTSLEGKILEAEKLKPSAAEPYFTPKRAHVCQAHEQSMFDPRLDHGKHAPAAALQQEGGIEKGKPPVPCAPLFRVQGYGGVVRDYTRGDISLHSCPNPLWLHPPTKVNMTQLTPTQQATYLAAVKAAERPPFPPQGCHLPAVAFDICGGPTQGLSCRDWARSRINTSSV